MTPARTRLRGEALTLAPLLVVTAFAALYVARHDVGVRTTAVVGVVLLLTQVLPGALVWRAMRPRDGWLLEDLAMGGAVGAALAVPGVLRVKGRASIAGKASPVVVQAVGPRLETWFATGGEGGGLVVIGLRDMDRAAVSARLAG